MGTITASSRCAPSALCSLFPTLWFSTCSLPQGAASGHGARISSAWRDSQEFRLSLPITPPAGDSAALQRQPDLPSLTASGEMPCCQGFLTQEHLHKAIPNYSWLHPGDSSNMRMRLMVLYYSTVWTGSWVF